MWTVAEPGFDQDRGKKLGSKKLLKKCLVITRKFGTIAKKYIMFSISMVYGSKST